jgi:sugar-specific transcriptional regulator TrmB
MAINQTLKKLGLNDKEIRVYLALLKSGKIKPSSLAKITKLNRATLYSVAKSLLSKGIVTEDISGKILHFIPLPPNSLGKILEQAKRELKEKEELIKNAVGELNLIATDKSYPVPKIRLIEEDHLEKYLFDNTVKWQEAVIASDGVWWGYQDQNFAEIFEKWIYSTWKTIQSKHSHYKPQFFSSNTEIEKKLSAKFAKDKRKIRLLNDTDFSANTWVCGDYLVMIVTQKHPFYLLEINDPMLAHNTREIFKKLWNCTNDK